MSRLLHRAVIWMVALAACAWAEPVVTESIPISYTSMQTALTVCKSAFPKLECRVGNKVLIVTGAQAYVEAFKKFMARLDGPLQKVLLDVRLVALTEDGTKTIARNRGFFKAEDSSKAPGIIHRVGPGYDYVAPLWKPSLGRMIGMFVSMDLATQLATSCVLTESGKEAAVLVGDRHPFIRFDPRIDQFQVTILDFGVNLAIKPTVPEAGTVQLEITATTRSFGRVLDNGLPQTYNWTTRQNVRFADGETFVLADVMPDAPPSSIDRPLLETLPVLGGYFRSSTKEKLVVLITAKVLP